MTDPDVALLGEALAAVPGDDVRFAAVCARVSDWPRFLDVAQVHGVDGLVYHYACAYGVDIPKAASDQVRRWTFIRSVTATLAIEAAGVVLEAMERAGVRVTPLKGGLLAARLYPDATLRPSSDLDLLVAESDLDAALAVLRGLGIELLDDAARVAYHRRHHYHVSAASADRTVYVELHFHAHRAWGGLLRAEELLERARMRDVVPGIAARILEPEDELLYLAVHYAKHYELNYRLLYDLKLFVGEHPDLDWTTLVERATTAGTLRALGVALRDLERALGIVPPPPARAARTGPRLAAFGAIRRLAAARPWPQPIRVALEVTAGAVLADTAPKGARWLAESGARIVRRRLHRAAPTALPPHWAG